MPGAPVLIAPVDGSNAHSDAPTFAWHPVEGRRATRSRWTTPIKDIRRTLPGQNETRRRPAEFVLTPGLSRGTYHWHVRAVSGSEVGDGVNDAPALAQADLSVTVAGGTDVAGETSDVVLTHLDLILVPGFIALSRRTRRTIMQNLGWAFAYNLVSVPLAALGFISPAIAAVTMAASSLLVVGNSLRLRG
jgi:hypothetical protein